MLVCNEPQNTTLDSTPSSLFTLESLNLSIPLVPSVEAEFWLQVIPAGDPVSQV